MLKSPVILGLALLLVGLAWGVSALTYICQIALWSGLRGRDLLISDYSCKRALVMRYKLDSLLLQLLRSSKLRCFMLHLAWLCLFWLWIEFGCCLRSAYGMDLLKLLYVCLIRRVALPPVLSWLSLFGIEHLLSVLDLFKRSFLLCLLLLVSLCCRRLSAKRLLIGLFFNALSFSSFIIFVILITKLLRWGLIALLAELSDWCIRPQVGTCIHIIPVKFTFFPVRLLYVKYVKISCVVMSLGLDLLLI